MKKLALCIFFFFFSLVIVNAKIPQGLEQDDKAIGEEIEKYLPADTFGYRPKVDTVTKINSKQDTYKVVVRTGTTYVTTEVLIQNGWVIRIGKHSVTYHPDCCDN